MAVHSACKCDERYCRAIKGKPSKSEACICFYDNRRATNIHPWPCYKQEHWVEKKCSACRAFGNCDYSDNPNAPYDCYCVMEIKICVRINAAKGNTTDVSERLLKFWEIQPNTTMSSVQEKNVDRGKAYDNTVQVHRANNRIYEKAYNQYESLMAVHSACKCDGSYCRAIKGRPSESEACICFYDNRVATNKPWPCYKQEHWVEKKCSACHAFNNCDYSDNPKAPYDCYCVKEIKMCVGINITEGNITDISERLVKFWEIQPSTSMSSVQKKKVDREKAYTVRVRQANNRNYEKAYNQSEGLMAVHSACKCGKSQCAAIKGKPSESKACICFYDNRQATSKPWPCYKQEHWVEKKCSACRAFGNCDYSDNPNAPYDCYCVMEIMMCVRINAAEGNTTDVSERLLKFWEMQPSTTKADREKAYTAKEYRDTECPDYLNRVPRDRSKAQVPNP
ncbi:unnamed protein product [Cylicocyclus nassatus]|uniref:Uncharacterized protein n=1 Tax=Cylicocyclus nassatus TaxID=53992 RepID=A0AA36DSX2_CYLNA|nr:unnamed protein product [Cylicocyclus nassatus]